MLDPELQAVTLQPANGRIWPVRPMASTTGLEVALCSPASIAGPLPRHSPFTAVAFDARGEYLAAVDKHGAVYSFNLKANRYVRLDRVGSAGTCATFSSMRTLFVAFQDTSIRVYDVVKSSTLGILREHRVAPHQLCVRSRSLELMSASSDSIILWDAKKLQRKRALGGGPWGALHSAFTADEEHLVAAFKDGSFYVWHVATAALVRSFSLPPRTGAAVSAAGGVAGPGGAGPRAPLHSTFSLSPDGQLLVAAGLRLPFLLVFNVMSGTFLHALLLPDTQIGTGGVSGATQLCFLPHSACTLLVLCSDGSIRVVDVAGATVVAQVPYSFPNRRDQCSFSLDAAAKQMAFVADGKVLLYDLARVRRVHAVDVQLTVVPAERLEDTLAQLPQPSPSLLDPSAAPSQRAASPPARPAAAQGQAGPGAHMQRADTKAQADRQRPGPGQRVRGVLRSPKGKAGGGAAGAGGVVLQRAKLESLLERFGEFPAKYRLMIWAFLLKLPRNQLAFQVLVNRGQHASFQDLPQRLPLASKALSSRLGHVLSQLAHWCPVFGEAGFLPGLVFPFVKLHMAGSTSASSESCFEMLATLLIHWTRGWFERFPEPPLSVLSRLDALLSFHDSALAVHLRRAHAGGVASMAWAIMQDLMSGVLTQADWLKVWDHCITAGPDFLHYFITAYFMAIRATLLEFDTSQRLMAYLSKPPDINTNKVLRHAYQLRLSTPPELHPCPREWDPLPATGAYTDFTQYPAAAVELFAQERKKIAEAEEALARRRKVASELALRSTALGLSTASLATERQQLAELQQARRDQLRQLESSMQAEAQKLDDVAKEERLKQIATVERAQQQVLASMRDEWQSELQSLRRDVAERRHALAAQFHNRAESEAISKLEFAARQKLEAMQREAAQQALLVKMREEAQAHTAELEALQRSKALQWQAEEEKRALKAQHEAERERRRTLAAEDAAAQAAVRREMVVTRLAVEDGIARVDAERQLLAVAEAQAAQTARAEREEARVAEAAADADTQTLALQAQIDASWYASEQQRRAQQLAEHHAALKADEQAARQQLLATQAQVRLLGSQAALLERRRGLEMLNAEEEAQARRVVAAISAERERAAQLGVELERREAALAQALAAAREQGEATRQAQDGAQAPAAPPVAPLGPDLQALRAAHAQQTRQQAAHERQTQQHGTLGQGVAAGGPPAPASATAPVEATPAGKGAYMRDFASSAGTPSPGALPSLPDTPAAALVLLGNITSGLGPDSDEDADGYGTAERARSWSKSGAEGGRRGIVTVRAGEGVQTGAGEAGSYGRRASAGELRSSRAGSLRAALRSGGGGVGSDGGVIPGLSRQQGASEASGTSAREEARALLELHQARPAVGLPGSREAPGRTQGAQLASGGSAWGYDMGGAGLLGLGRLMDAGAAAGRVSVPSAGALSVGTEFSLLSKPAVGRGSEAGARDADGALEGGVRPGAVAAAVRLFESAELGRPDAAAGENARAARYSAAGTNMTPTAAVAIETASTYGAAAGVAARAYGANRSKEPDAGTQLTNSDHGVGLAGGSGDGSGAEAGAGAALSASGLGPSEGGRYGRTAAAVSTSQRPTVSSNASGAGTRGAGVKESARGGVKGSPPGSPEEVESRRTGAAATAAKEGFLRSADVAAAGSSGVAREGAVGKGGTQAGSGADASGGFSDAQHAGETGAGGSGGGMAVETAARDLSMSGRAAPETIRPNMSGSGVEAGGGDSGLYPWPAGLHPPPAPSASGDESDVDVDELLNRMRNELALSDTDEEDWVRGMASTAASTPLPPPRPMQARAAPAVAPGELTVAVQLPAAGAATAVPSVTLLTNSVLMPAKAPVLQRQEGPGRQSLPTDGTIAPAWPARDVPGLQAPLGDTSRTAKPSVTGVQPGEQAVATQQQGITTAAADPGPTAITSLAALRRPATTAAVHTSRPGVTSTTGAGSDAGLTGEASSSLSALTYSESAEGATGSGLVESASAGAAGAGRAGSGGGAWGRAGGRLSGSGADGGVGGREGLGADLVAAAGSNVNSESAAYRPVGRLPPLVFGQRVGGTGSVAGGEVAGGAGLGFPGDGLAAGAMQVGLRTGASGASPDALPSCKWGGTGDMHDALAQSASGRFTRAQDMSAAGTGTLPETCSGAREHCPRPLVDVAFD